MINVATPVNRFENLSKDFHYFLKHQKSLVTKYKGKVLAIKNEKIIGVYDTVADAYYATLKEHQLGTFLLQKCGVDDKCYTVHVHAPILAKA